MTFFNIYNWRRKAIPLLISGLIISCSPLNPLGLASQQYTAIAELGKLANKSSVNLQGMVVNIAPFLEGGAYQLQDATGFVWVKTNKPLPPKGTSLSVQGEIQYEAIFVGQQQLGESYLLEVSQEPQSSKVSTEVIPNPSPKPPETFTNPNIPPQRDRAHTPPSPMPSVEPNKNIAVPVVESLSTKTPPALINPIQVETPTPSPTPSPLNEPEKIKVINPITPPSTKPIPSPSTTKLPAKLNLDDQFLPHKRLPK